MKFTVSLYLLLMAMIVSCKADMEPKCSKFDFEEKLLEKMVRMEHQNKVMMEDFMKISQQVKEDQRYVNEEVVKMKTEFDKVTEVKQHINEELVAMKTEFAEIQRQDPKTLIEEYLRQPSYAFNAYWLANTNPANGDALVFTRIHLNEGNVYDSSTGKYTAPLNGTYLFSTTLCFNTAMWAFIHFIVDGTPNGVFLAGNSQGRDAHCASSTVTVFLQKGMQVWLKVYNKSPGTPFINGHNQYHSHFAGHLIKEV